MTNNHPDDESRSKHERDPEKQFLVDKLVRKVGPVLDDGFEVDGEENYDEEDYY